METSDSGEVAILGAAETNMEIKIKTLDSQTYTLRVNKFMPVTALKEQVANVTGVLSEQQRLICRGKVLKDDQLLSAYNVEDGHTLHLVVRQPPLASTSGLMEPENVPSHSGTNPALSTIHSHQITLGRNVLFGTFSIADRVDPVTSEYGQETSSDRAERASGSGALDPAQTESNQTTAWMEVNQPQSAYRTSSEHSLGQQHPTVIPDALTTLFQYLSHIRQEFETNGGTHGSSTETSNPHYGGGQSHSSHPHLPLAQGLPTPASLAEILLSARQLLMEQAGGCLHDLARQLEGHASVTDPLIRTNIQSYAVRSGVLFQNLGSLLLEIGRTTMTLRMSQTPSEAVVNAGPAIFISSLGPNPLMVQAGTGFGGIPMGPSLPGHGLGGAPLGSGLLSGNVDILIRRVPSTTTNNGEQVVVQNPSERTDTTRTTGEIFSHQSFQGFPANASIRRDPGMSVGPSRTVVAVPARVHHPQSDSPGGAVGLLYPLLARFQRQRPGSLSDARISQTSIGTGAAQQQTPNSVGSDELAQEGRFSSSSGSSIRASSSFSSSNLGSLLDGESRFHYFHDSLFEPTPVYIPLQEISLAEEIACGIQSTQFFNLYALDDMSKQSSSFDCAGVCSPTATVPQIRQGRVSLSRGELMVTPGDISCVITWLQ